MMRGRFRARLGSMCVGIVAGILLLNVGLVRAQSSGPDALARPLVGDLPPAPEEVYVPHPPGIQVSPYAIGLAVIWSIEFAPDGRLFIAERQGNVRIVNPDGQLDSIPWLSLETGTRREDGLLGLTLHPDFGNKPWVYVFYTHQKGDELVNRVSRFRDVDGRAADEDVLVDDLRSDQIHNGGRLRFGPDGMLYVGLGDVADPMIAQDLSDPAGSILRITPDGAVPADNPWSGDPIWAYGLRNVNGLTFREDGALFAADHGPSSEWRDPLIPARDEINIIRRGGNYGWPIAVGAPGVPEFEDPLLAWVPAAPPGDLLFYYGDLMPELNGDLFFSTLRSETLMRIRFEDPGNRDRVTAIERWFHSGEPGAGGSVHGRLRGMTVGPDGALYVGTGNQDGRSPLREGDDQVLRIGPAQ